ncbi:MAG: hypothetical protein ACOC2W_03915, partial [bacterium]
FMEKNCKKDYIKKSALIFNDIYNADGQGKKIIDIYINESAGNYLTKEVLEFFDFKIDENNYNENLSEYIEMLDNVLYLVNDWLEKNIIIDDIYIMVEVDGNFQLSAYYELDYDILVDNTGRIKEESIIYRKKELETNMLEVIEKCFIIGTDADAKICLNEGYVSIWKNDYNNKIMVYSFYCPDEKVIYCETIPYQTKQDALDDIDNVDEGFLSYADVTKEELKEQVKGEAERCSFYTILQDYQGQPFTNLFYENDYNKFNNLLEVLEFITGYTINETD